MSFCHDVSHTQKNRDSAVTVADIVLSVAFVTGSIAPGQAFNEQAGDIDGNGSVDVSDIVQLVDLVLN